MNQTTAQQIAQRLVTISISNEAPVMEIAGRRRPSFVFLAEARNLGAKGTADLHAEVVAILEGAVASGAAV